MRARLLAVAVSAALLAVTVAAPSIGPPARAGRSAGQPAPGCPGGRHALGLGDLAGHYVVLESAALAHRRGGSDLTRRLMLELVPLLDLVWVDSGSTPVRHASGWPA